MEKPRTYRTGPRYVHLRFIYGHTSRAGGAKLGAFQVDAFDAVGGAHDAGVIGAMAQAVGVAQFVEGFFQQAFWRSSGSAGMP